MAKRRSAPPARTDTEALVYRWVPVSTPSSSTWP